MQRCEPECVDMRIYKHEDSRVQGRIGATAATGRQPRVGRLPATSRRKVSGRLPQHSVPLDEGISPRRRRSPRGTRSHRTTAKAHTPARTSSPGLVRPLADQVRFSYGTVDRGTRGAGDLSQVARQVSSALSESVACGTTHHAAEAAIPRREQDEDEVQRWLREDWPRIKKVRRGGMHTWF